MEANRSFTPNAKDSTKRKTQRLLKNSNSRIVNSRFVRPQKKYYRFVSPSQFIVTLPQITTPSPPKSPKTVVTSTDRPDDRLVSTSTSTSVSMSYTTVLDSAKITTVLNSNHFLLTSRKKKNKDLKSNLSNISSKSGSSLTRSYLPFDYFSRFSSKGRKATKDTWQ